MARRRQGLGANRTRSAPMRQPAQAPMQHGLECRRSGAGISKTRLEKCCEKRTCFKLRVDVMKDSYRIASGPNGWGIKKGCSTLRNCCHGLNKNGRGRSRHGDRNLNPEVQPSELINDKANWVSLLLHADFRSPWISSLVKN